MEVISTITSRDWDFIFGREKSPNEEDQYAAIIVMYPPNSIQKMLKEEIVREIGRYIVETGSLDELSKYKEVGVFSEWPSFRLDGWKKHKDIPQVLEDRDKEFLEWRYKTLKEYVPIPEMKVEHGSKIWRAIHEREKKTWWKRLLGMR